MILYTYTSLWYILHVKDDSLQLYIPMVHLFLRVKEERVGDCKGLQQQRLFGALAGNPGPVHGAHVVLGDLVLPSGL